MATSGLRSFLLTGLVMFPHDPRRNAPLIGSVHECGGRDLDSRTTKASLLR